MFARLFAVASFVVLAVAGPAPIALRGECNTGSINCCNTVVPASDAHNLLNLTGINVLADLENLVGIDCSPISVVGLGSNSCSQQPVCCTGDTFNGLINIGCNSISL